MTRTPLRVIVVIRKDDQERLCRNSHFTYQPLLCSSENVIKPLSAMENTPPTSQARRQIRGDYLAPAERTREAKS
jgi:hypothetical protein